MLRRVICAAVVVNLAALRVVVVVRLVLPSLVVLVTLHVLLHSISDTLFVLKVTQSQLGRFAQLYLAFHDFSFTHWHHLVNSLLRANDLSQVIAMLNGAQQILVSFSLRRIGWWGLEVSHVAEIRGDFVVVCLLELSWELEVLHHI